jgi:hypothetical protein
MAKLPYHRWHDINARHCLQHPIISSPLELSFSKTENVLTVKFRWVRAHGLSGMDRNSILNKKFKSLITIHTIMSMVQTYSDNSIPELPNTALSCSWHGPAAAWLMSAWPGNILPVPKTFTLFVV